MPLDKLHWITLHSKVFHSEHFSGGQIGRALLNAAGEGLEQEYSKLPKFKTGDVVLTGAGKLHAKSLLHMVTKTNAVTPDNSMIHDAVRKCLDKADDWGLTSLSLPAVGTGHLQKDAKESAKILYSCVEEYQKRKEKKLKLIKIVILEENMFADFKKAFGKKDTTMTTEPEGKTIFQNSLIIHEPKIF